MLRPWFRLTGALVFASAAVVGCSNPPPEGGAAADLDGVAAPPGQGGLMTNGLMPPLPACCPGQRCCDPNCRYSDTADPWLDVPTGLVTGPEGISVPSHRVGNPNASACVNQEVTALDAPVAIFYAMARDLPMDADTASCIRTERRCAWGRCWDECVERKSRWDEVREGTQQFAQDNALSQGTFGANAVNPLWDMVNQQTCRTTCFVGGTREVRWQSNEIRHRNVGACQDTGDTPRCDNICSQNKPANTTIGGCNIWHCAPWVFGGRTNVCKCFDCFGYQLDLTPYCRTDCTTSTTPELTCDRNRYERWDARFGQFSGWAAAFMGELWNKTTAPIRGNVGQWAQQNAYNRAREYLAANPTAMAAVNLVVDDFPNGCGNGDIGAMAANAQDAFSSWPSIQTNVLAVGLQGVDPPPYRSVYQNGGGVDRYIDPVDDVNGNTRRELTDIRRLSSKRAFIIPLPASGEPVNLDTLRFRLRQGNTDYPLFRFESRADCGWNDGYWVDFPEGARGRPRVNLCQRTKMWADGALPTGIANYDCIGERAPSATYVRTNDFNLAKCQSVGDKPRLLRLDWRSVLPWNTWIQFRLQAAPRQQDLAAAPALVFNATSWTANAVGWADLSTVALPTDYAWARLSATLVTSTDEFHRYTPTLRSWDLTFTCVDAN